MSDYGPEISGGFASALSTTILRDVIPLVGSLFSPAQIAKGDKYRREAQTLLDQHFDKFPDQSKYEIRNLLRQ